MSLRSPRSANVKQCAPRSRERVWEGDRSNEIEAADRIGRLDFPRHGSDVQWYSCGPLVPWSEDGRIDCDGGCDQANDNAPIEPLNDSACDRSNGGTRQAADRR